MIDDALIREMGLQHVPAVSRGEAALKRLGVEAESIAQLKLQERTMGRQVWDFPGDPGWTQDSDEAYAAHADRLERLRERIAVRSERLWSWAERVSTP